MFRVVGEGPGELIPPEWMEPRGLGPESPPNILYCKHGVFPEEMVGRGGTGAVAMIGE